MTPAPDPLSTTSLCATCRRGLPAQYVERESGVYLEKTCPEHGAQSVLIATDPAWWRRTLAESAAPTPPDGAKPPTHGCPFDCGPCTQHQQRVHLPILPITAACNLDCPICYTHNAHNWNLSDAEMAAVLRHLSLAAPDRRLLNITGGEPTLHPRLIPLLEQAAAAGIQRITLSTHGLRLAHDEALVRRLGELGVRVILSFDSFDEATNKAMLGGSFGAAKLRALDMLEKYNVDTSLLPVLAKGQNDSEIGLFVGYMLSHTHIRSLEIHPLTFTGQGGASFNRAARITPDEVLRAIAVQCAMSVDDFVPSPLAHPLCYQCSYLLRLPSGQWLPFTRFMRRDQLRELLSEGLYLSPGPRMEQTFREVIDALWSGEFACTLAAEVLEALRSLLDGLFDATQSESARLKSAEQQTRAIYVHTHMDEESFDTDRVRLCPVGIREADGRNVPSCSYNVLYRRADTRFVDHPEWNFSGGRIF